MKPNLADVKKTLKRTNFPVSVIIETVAYCNLNCIMCPQPSLKRQRGAMDIRVSRKIIDEIAGVAEFDQKKEQSLRELDVVRERIEREELLNRRLVFHHEDVRWHVRVAD